MSNSIKQTKEIFPGEVFASTTDFDTSIRQLIPKYDEMLDTVVSCLPSGASKILELGCGTGELSLKLLQRYSGARIVAVDYSPRMIELAKSKIETAEFGDRWQGIEMDFGDWAKGETEAVGHQFDAVVSSLAIHHLTNEMKLMLFRQINHSLNPSGVFWNADPVIQEYPLLSSVYQNLRDSWLSMQGISDEALRALKGTSRSYGHSQPDQLTSLDNHLQMLRTAGFAPVEVPWKYFGLAVFGGVSTG